MFILLNEPSVIKNNQPTIVVRSNYNPLDDNNISGLTTHNGNWIKKKVFLFDFLNLKKSLKPKTLTKIVKGTDTIYSYPGDIPIETKEYENTVNYHDTLIDVSHSFWGKSGGTDFAVFEMNINIPWNDIQSWLKSNKINEKEGKIKSIYLVPEIQLINAPLNSATIQFKNLKINDKLSSNSDHVNNLVIPEGMQESEWTASDIWGAILKAGGFAVGASGFFVTGGASIILTGLGLGASGLSLINDHLSASHPNYIYTNREENRIKIANDLNVEYGKDLNISIPEIKITGTRKDGKYWADYTHATLSNIYLVMELE